MGKGRCGRGAEVDLAHSHSLFSSIRFYRKSTRRYLVQTIPPQSELVLVPTLSTVSGSPSSSSRSTSPAPSTYRPRLSSYRTGHSPDSILASSASSSSRAARLVLSPNSARSLLSPHLRSRNHRHGTDSVFLLSTRCNRCLDLPMMRSSARCARWSVPLPLSLDPSSRGACSDCLELTWTLTLRQTAFIKQEALEKAREIKVKADEEFAIEKGKIVRQESANIDANFERKKKQAEIERKM